MTFPLVELSGSHYSVGFDLGRHFSVRINTFVEQLRTELPDYQRLLAQNFPYLKATQSAFPNLVEELVGVATGARIPPEEYFFLTNPELQTATEPYLAKLHLVGDHCSTLVSFNQQGAIIGHNEDYDPAMQDDLYLLKATINGVTIFGLQYITEMIGTAASVNSYGLVQCINELHSNYRTGLPKNFIARAVLQCQTIEEAEGLITRVKHASGFNHVLIQGDKITNIEIAGPKIAVTHFTHEPFSHTNHYLSPDLKESEKYHTASSRHRLRRLTQLVRPGMSLSGVQATLKDHHHPKHSICRHNHTLGSVIFEPSLNRAHVCYGRPCEGNYVEYSLV
jgi:predicted choloylglycine hydrolase